MSPKSVIPPENYKVQHIAVKFLSVVWAQCQRPYNEKWANEIAENFDPDKFEPIVVTQPNGHGIYHIIEGQHRVHALEKYAGKFGPGAENEMCPCRVIEEADPARAADIFLGINASRKSVKPIIAFSVAVIAKHEPEVAINKIVNRAGYRIAPTKGDDCVSAVSALKHVYIRHSGKTLEYTLQVLRNLWSSDPQAVSSVMIRGFAIFIHEFSEHINLQRLRLKVGDRFTPWKFRAAAEVRKQSTLERLDETIAELLIREYNKGAKEGTKLKRKST